MVCVLGDTVFPQKFVLGSGVHDGALKEGATDEEQEEKQFEMSRFAHLE